MNTKTQKKYYCMWCGKTHNELPVASKCSHCGKQSLKLVRVEEKNPHKSQIIKISSIDVINSMRNGEFWFQSPKYFQEYRGDGQKARADIHDAKYSYIDKNNFVDDTNANQYRILCFYSLNVDKNGDFLEIPNKGLEGFGDYFSIVDIQTLLSKIKSYVIEQDSGISYFANYVKYIEENYFGVYTPFCKFSDFSYQKEFRIVMIASYFAKLKEKEAYKTIPYIGNLSDVILEPQPIKNLLKSKNIDDF